MIATFSGYYYVKSQLEPKDEASKEKITVEIPAGSSISDISTILEDKKVINNASIFSFYVKYNNDTNLKAGNYELSPAMNTDQIVKKNARRKNGGTCQTSHSRRLHVRPNC
ncbi:aminodeoxychorismate lyase family protein [Listeria monocytogenes FSL F6-684]|nr:aminodeoxychorismate lyase family protein [Listeria monocytogenes FSL F6-684]